MATKYSVSESWVRRLKQRRRQTGETAPRLPGPRRPPQLDAYRQRLQELHPGLQDRLGLTLLNLGHPREALPLFVKARQTRQDQLGPDHPDTLTSMNNLAKGYEDAGQLDQALPLFEETLPLLKANLLTRQ